jgi:hypothetical protein
MRVAWVGEALAGADGEVLTGGMVAGRLLTGSTKISLGAARAYRS